MAEKQYFVTKEGLEALEKEYEHLVTVGRKDAAEKLKVARSFGDLSENSEYDEAKNDQAIMEARIADLEVMLKNVVILDESEIVKDVISLGSNVKVYDEEFEEELEYVIVGSTEADLDLGKISDESPVGKALMGKKVGDVAEAILPTGDTAKFRVISIG